MRASPAPRALPLATKNGAEDRTTCSATSDSASKTAGILVDRENVRRYVNQGVGFLYVHANNFLAKGAADFADLLGRK